MFSAISFRQPAPAGQLTQLAGSFNADAWLLLILGIFPNHGGFPYCFLGIFPQDIGIFLS